VFQRNCFSCHVLFGEGGKFGPDLSGGNRRDMHYLLENIIDPNALLPQDYWVTSFKLKDGRVILGRTVAKTERASTIQTSGEKVVVPNKDIVDAETREASIMPEGLLGILADDEVRDLIAYIRGNGPVALPGE